MVDDDDDDDGDEDHDDDDLYGYLRNRNYLKLFDELLP